VPPRSPNYPGVTEENNEPQSRCVGTDWNRAPLRHKSKALPLQSIQSQKINRVYVLGTLRYTIMYTELKIKSLLKSGSQLFQSLAGRRISCLKAWLF